MVGRHRWRPWLMLVFLFLTVAREAPATPTVVTPDSVPPDSMDAACAHFLALAREQGAAWLETPPPSIGRFWDLVVDDTLRARCYSILPAGHAVIDATDPGHRVIAYSDACDLAPDTHPEIVEFLSSGWESGQRTRRTSGDRGTVADEPSGDGPGLEGAGPLLTTMWHQRFPYDRFCPMGDGGRTAVGCVITAATQIMRYHGWPREGVGTHEFTWDGDQSCDGDVGGGVLSASFSDPYDWQNMPAHCDAGCSLVQQNALSELCYEVGVGAEADYGFCGTGAPETELVRALVDHFRYDDTVVHEIRSQHTAESWFAMIRAEIDLNSPILYSNGGHAWVCDGWRILGSSNQIHINWGTGQEGYTGWWDVDEMPDTPDPMDIYLRRGIRPVCRVGADGCDFATIQAALDYFHGACAILLAPGVHAGAGNRDLHLLRNGLEIRGAGDGPGASVVDCDGAADDPHRMVQVEVGVDVTMRGFTIRNGFADRGGAILCSGSNTLSIDDMNFEDNVAQAHGGAIHAVSGTVDARGCRFARNRAASGGAVALDLAAGEVSGCEFAWNESDQGGAIHASGSSLEMGQCTLYANEGALGAIRAGEGASIAASNSIVAGTVVGGAGSCSESATMTFSCSDLWENEAGDWTGCLEGQAGQSGNFSADPLFCDPGAGDLALDLHSPCSPDQNPGCWIVGAHPIGCAADSILIVNADGTGQHPTIQAAIDAATDGMVVLLSPGTYSGDGNRDLDFRGKAITLRSEGCIPESCRIDCGGGQFPEYEQHRGIVLNHVDRGEARIQGITIRRGFVSAGAGAEELGGAAILCVGSLLSVDRCILEDNLAEGNGHNTYGGAVCAEGSTLRIATSRLSGNVAEYGGGVAALRSSIEAIDCTFTGNECTQRGGGIAVHAASTLSMSGCVLDSNRSGYSGGGLSVNGGEATVIASTFANQTGGGVYASAADVSFARTALHHNQGSGFHIASGTAEVELCTFYSNIGDGIRNEAATLDVGLCTFYGNGGSGIYTGEDASIHRTILSNSANGAVRCMTGGLHVVLSCCDLFASGGGNWTGCIAGQNGQNGNFSADPLFCDAAGAGDFHLRDGSPCLPPGGGCESIGAWGAGCGLTIDVEEAPAPSRVPSLSIGSILPNPSSARVWIHVTLSAGVSTVAAPGIVPATMPRAARLTVHEISGRMIRDLTPALGAGGPEMVIEWDGMDASGRRVAAGVYYCLLRDAAGRETSSFVRVR